jgi:hypothetical protein
MIRYALLLCAALLAAVTFACVAPPAPPPPPPPEVMAAIAPLKVTWPLTGTDCNAGNFAAGVTILNAGFDPNTPPYVAPSGTVRPGSIIQGDLQDAFSNAPLLVQNHLCALTGGVFINPTSCSTNPCRAVELFGKSWGFRSRQGTDKKKTYIAISDQLWPSAGGHAMDLATYQQNILQYLATKTGAWSSSPLPNVGSPSPSDQPSLTVLAALAHELGHVQWVLDAAANPGNDYDFSSFENCKYSTANGFTFTTDFFQGWDYQGKNGRLAPQMRWRKFANKYNNENRITEHANPPYLSDFFSGSGDPNQLLIQLLQDDQPWASFFGAQTPDEDFVETYVLYALLGNRFDNSSFNGVYLASLPVTIPGSNQTADVPKDLLAGSKSVLTAKISCLEGLTPAVSRAHHRRRHRHH